MSAPLAPNPDGYVHARTDEEAERLRLQSRIWQAATEQALTAADLVEGMTCLDVGCGPGEAMRLMARRVGAGGRVAGLDIDGDLGRRMLPGLQAEVPAPLEFHEGDVASLTALPGAPYDLTFTRFTLMHLADPAGALAKMRAATRPGGFVVAQDYDFGEPPAEPSHPGQEEFEAVFRGVFRAHGKALKSGRSLPALFRSAGLGEPDGTDAAVRFAPLRQLAPLLLGVYNGLWPAARRLGLSDEAKAAAFRRDLAAAAESGRYDFSPLVVSAWKRVSPGPTP